MKSAPQVRPPSPFVRFIYRLPLYAYRARMGALLGGRFIWLHHTGRISGLPRQTVLEVAFHDRAEDVYYVVSGYGAKADWYRNLAATPSAWGQVGRRRFSLRAEQLNSAASGQFLVDYAERNPTVIRGLMKVLGLPTYAEAELYRQLGETILPAVALHVNGPK